MMFLTAVLAPTHSLGAPVMTYSYRVNFEADLMTEASVKTRPLGFA